jgi:hypothetical protein
MRSKVFAVFAVCSFVLIVAGLLRHAPSPTFVQVVDLAGASERDNRATEQSRGVATTGYPVGIGQTAAAESSANSHQETTPRGDTARDDSRLIADLHALYISESDAGVRADLAASLGNVASPDAVRELLDLLQTETDPDAIEAILRTLATADAGGEMAQEVLAALDSLYRASNDTGLHLQIQGTAAAFATRQAADLLRRAYQDPNSAPEETLGAGENLLRLRVLDSRLVSDAEAAAVNERLRAEAQAWEDPEARARAYMALGIMQPQNTPFLRRMRDSETDSALRRLLDGILMMGGDRSA